MTGAFNLPWAVPEWPSIDEVLGWSCDQKRLTDNLECTKINTTCHLIFHPTLIGAISMRQTKPLLQSEAWPTATEQAYDDIETLPRTEFSGIIPCLPGSQFGDAPKSAQNRSESLCAGLWVPCRILGAWLGPA